MPTTNTNPLPYVVKCDDCKTTLRAVATVRESAEGGTCDSCKGGK